MTGVVQNAQVEILKQHVLQKIGNLAIKGVHILGLLQKHQ